MSALPSRALLLLAVVGASLLGCGGGNQPAAQSPASGGDAISNTQAAEPAAPPPLTRNERVLADMEELAVKMCACTESACARQVSEELTAWSQKQAAEDSEPVKLSEEQMQRATTAGERMAACMQRAMGAGTP